MSSWRRPASRWVVESMRSNNYDLVTRLRLVTHEARGSASEPVAPDALPMKTKPTALAAGDEGVRVEPGDSLLILESRLSLRESSGAERCFCGAKGDIRQSRQGSAFPGGAWEPGETYWERRRERQATRQVGKPAPHLVSHPFLRSQS